MSGPAQSTSAYLSRVASLPHRLRGGGRVFFPGRQRGQEEVLGVQGRLGVLRGDGWAGMAQGSPGDLGLHAESVGA